MSYKSKICPICGDTFIPKSAKQKYCKKVILLNCAVCGIEFEGICQPDNVSTCSNHDCKKKAACIGTSNTTKICRLCGSRFIPNSSRQLDCNQIVTKKCVICGQTFLGRCSQNDKIETCSPKCQIVYAHNQSVKSYSREIRICELCGKEFVPVNNTQHICKDTHYRNCEVCGKPFILDTTKLKVDWPTTCSKTCAAKLAHDNITFEMKQDVILNMRIRRHKDDPESLKRYLEFLDNPHKYLNSYYRDNKPSLIELAKSFGIHETTMGQYINNLGLKDYIAYTISYMENDVVSFIKHLDSSIKIVERDRHTIHPKELDIYLPEYHIAFECNPTETHNSSIPDPWGGEPKHYKYHQMKTQLCEDNGIFLFHIFGYEWEHKRPIIESMIRNLLGKNQNRYYARKLIVKHVDFDTAKKFLDSNHRQGNACAPIRLGLYTSDNELVSLMTFNKKRHTIGPDLDNNSYELVRFCSKLNTTVVGGADKLFKYFVKHYNPNAIISFSDRAHTRGNLYSKLGFVEVTMSSPGYLWVDSITNIAYHRINAQKKNICKFLQDENIDLSKTERQIMEEHGFVIIYDSGTITWRWSKI